MSKCGIVNSFWLLIVFILILAALVAPSLSRFISS
jgi:hypothetical protein